MAAVPSTGPAGAAAFDAHALYERQYPLVLRFCRSKLRSREDADFFVRWIDRLDQAARAHEAWNTPEEREHVLRLLGRARAVYAEQAGANP